jgi:methylated-DNA-protein-cysteine methyltransferase related protein
MASKRAENILTTVRSIPEGFVRTYGDIAPDAPRLVGQVLSTTHDGVPWHRVVRADGSLPMGDVQWVLLTEEGVPMCNGRVDLSRARLPAATGETGVRSTRQGR